MGKGLAITSLVTGIISMLLFLVPFIGFILAITAIITGILGLKKKQGGMAIAGLITGIIGLLLGSIIIIGAIAYFGVLSPTTLIPERTMMGPPIQALDNANVNYNLNTIDLSLINNVGNTIIIEDGKIAHEKGECMLEETEKEVQNGERFGLTWACDFTEYGRGDRFRAEIEIQYTNTATGMTINHMGTIMSEIR